MTKQPKQIKVIGSRPAHPSTSSGFGIPTGWPIYNAPRPLYGDPTWTGDFIHGIFYATVDPSDPYGPGFIQRNAELDAWELVWVSEEEAVAESMARLVVEYPVEATEIDPEDLEHREWLITSFLERQRS